MRLASSRTKIFSALRYHPAVDFPQAISDVEDLEGIGYDFILVICCDVLHLLLACFDGGVRGGRGVEVVN